MGVAVSEHTAIGSNMKRLWVAANVEKICLKCPNFRITVSSNYSKNWGKIYFKIFPLKIEYYIWLFSWHLLEISDYTVVGKNIFKTQEKFPQNPLLWKFPHSSFKFLNICQFPQNFGIHTNFLEIFESLFPQITPDVRKNFTPYFHGIVRPKICLQFAFKNFKYILPQIIFLCSTPSPPLRCSSPSPIIPSATMIIQVHVSGEQGDWLEAKMGSFEIQPAAKNDIISLANYSSNIAIYTRVARCADLSAHVRILIFVWNCGDFQ